MRNAEFGLRHGDQEKESRFERIAAGEKAYWPNEPIASQAQGRDRDRPGFASCGGWVDAPVSTSALVTACRAWILGAACSGGQSVPVAGRRAGYREFRNASRAC